MDSPDNDKVGSTLVVGGGIGGIQAALDLADSGFKVYLVEKKPSIGGIMAQLDKTFPTNDCSMCILAPKLVSVARHPNITIITNSEIETLAGKAGHFVVTLKKHPRYVDTDKCTGCGVCMQECPVRQAFYLEDPIEETTLSVDEIKKTKIMIDKYRNVRGKLMPILQRINHEYNYLPIEVLKYISTELKIPLSLIYNVATFYKAFSLKKRGRHIIKVCQGTACHVRGADQVLEQFQRTLGVQAGENTEDLAFSLETVNCVGACALAPVVVVDRDYYGHMTPERVKKVIDIYHRK